MIPRAWVLKPFPERKSSARMALRSDIPQLQNRLTFFPSRLSLLPQRDLTLLGTFTITPLIEV
jgi:hypothetical protein